MNKFIKFIKRILHKNKLAKDITMTYDNEFLKDAVPRVQPVSFNPYKSRRH